MNVSHRFQPPIVLIFAKNWANFLKKMQLSAEKVDKYLDNSINIKTIYFH